MIRKSAFYSAFLLVFSFAAVAVAQTPSTVKPSVVTGDVTSVTESAIKLKTASGDLAIEVAANTEFKRVPADNPKLSAAVPVERTAIANGDKLVISGFYAADMSKLAARTVYLMAKSDIDEKKAKEAARWSTRGMSGKVTAVDAAAKKITVEVRGLMGTTTLTVNPTDSTVYKRYAPGSVKYSESIAGSLANIQVGDMLRAVGDRSADGTAFTAEEILTGSFETIAGTVKSVDAANNQVTITNLQTQKDVIVDLKTASLMKRFPEEMAMRLAAFQGGGPNGGARPGGGQPQAGGQPAAGGQPGGAPGQGQQRPGGGMGGGPRGGIDEMLERFPSISVADLKPGDMIAVSSSKDHSDDRLTAIKVLAGVEPFIRAAQASGAMQRGGRGMGQGAFTIPGLDGVDFQ